MNLILSTRIVTYIYYTHHTVRTGENRLSDAIIVSGGGVVTHLDTGGKKAGAKVAHKELLATHNPEIGFMVCCYWGRGGRNLIGRFCGGWFMFF